VLFAAVIYLGTANGALPTAEPANASSSALPKLVIPRGESVNANVNVNLANESVSLGVLRFVDGLGTPLAGATMRILCYASAGDTAPMADVQRTTDPGGLPLMGVPGGCNYVAAMQLVHTQPSGKLNHGPAYWVYATSWSPYTPALLPSTGDVTVTLANPLVLFNVVASLEWQPAAGSPYAALLMAGLRSASNYLYGLTEGQMAIGPVTIQTGGGGWEISDLRFRAANDYRPSARVGGIVPAPRPYAASATTETVYMPGEILLGRYWDGNGASNPVTGNWSQPNAYRTLIHEWGHYALFLYDEYQANGLFGSDESYCTCSDLPLVTSVSNPAVCGGVTSAMAQSAMAYHYTASKLWLSGTPPVCMNTDQWLVHGRQDWQTLAKWSHIQGLPTEWLNVPAALNVGPDLGIAGSLFGRAPGFQGYLPVVMGGSGSASTVFAEPVISVTAGSVLTTTELQSLYPQVFITSPSQSRVVYEGTTNGPRLAPNFLGKLSLFGVPPDGRARIYIDRYASSTAIGGRFIYPAPGGGDPPLADGQTLHAVVDKWRSSLDVAFDANGRLLTTMTVTLISLDPLKQPMAQLCAPDASMGCPARPQWRQAMLATGAITWTATFTAPPGTELPHYGVIDVQAKGGLELMRTYLSSGGVGPAHIDGNAPLVDGLVTVDAVQPVPGVHNQVVVMQAANYDALQAKLPDVIRGLIGMPLDVRVLLPNEAPLGAARAAALSRSQTQSPAAPEQANFSAFPTAGVAPLAVQFTNLSTNFASSLWDFGDGGQSVATNPVHTYTVPGLYTVTLTVSEFFGKPSTLTKRNYVRVRQPGTLIVTLFFDPNILRRLDVSPAQLVVLRFDRQTRQWVILQPRTTSRSGTLYWLASPPVDSSGIYALGWT
jgi:hypothetical protein